ncbi:uncharacterized protein [Rutidosis leptorrhynchoides]|uniref:uncharacterized protein n=1 Tax=Rutidosis leptorrhynchoides TaxID=125765 RepID=UPI003A990754
MNEILSNINADIGHSSDRVRMNTEGDRLSSLSDDLIIKILSYNNDTKQAIRTSILSSRWKNIWNSIPHFDLSSDDFTSRPHEFTRYLSSRNSEIELSSVKLSVGEYRHAFVKTVVDYAFSHNVQKMTIIWSDEMCLKIPSSLFTSQPLKDLTLIGSASNFRKPRITSSLDLPALTTLHLENVILNNENSGGLFSKCLNLKNLTLSNCDISDHNPFISHSEFSNLSNCNNEIELTSLKLSVGRYRQAFVKTVVDYAFSRSVQKMTIIWSDETRLRIPSSLFTSQSLKDLTLIGSASNFRQPRITSSLDLPVLTTLHLENVILNNEIPGGVFSKCLNLKNLTLSNCDISDHNPFISHSEFSNLSNCNTEIELTSLKLSVGRYRQAFVKTVVDYAFSRNVQKMTIIWLDNTRIEIPTFLFMSHTLKDLTFIGSVGYLSQPEIKSSLDLPLLTTLYLKNVRLSNENRDECGGVFFKCLNLKNLTLFKCNIGDPNNLISPSEFSKLTLEKGLYSFANVVVPHLKNLTLVDCQGSLFIYAPELSSLMYEVPFYANFFANGLSCLEKVDFYMCPYEEDGHAVIKILQQFHNVKYLTLGLEILELASIVHVVSDLPSPFAKLASLKIYPRRKKGKKKVKIPTQVKNFLLGSSPNVTVSIYSREEVEALKNATSAQRIMPKLQGFVQ